MTKPILSILTPSVPSRRDKLAALCDKIEHQISDLPVEHLVLLDNKRRSVGLKRDALLRAARGKYVAFVDDDDDIAEDYVAEILRAASESPDVITFNQDAFVNGENSTVEFRLGNPNEPFTPGGATLRNAWHVCAWRRSLAVCSNFPDNSYGEDWEFAARLCAMPRLREVHIPRVLHIYRHSADSTEAPPPLTMPQKQ